MHAVGIGHVTIIQSLLVFCSAHLLPYSDFYDRYQGFSIVFEDLCVFLR